MKTTISLKQARAFFIRQVIREMREWARAKRKAEFSESRYGYPTHEQLQEKYAFGESLGASSVAHSFALCVAGHDAALINRLERLSNRRTRIIHAKILRRPGERPAFFVQSADDRTMPAVPLVVLLDANREDEDLCRWAVKAERGAEYRAGGGAAPEVVIRRER